MLGKTVCDKNIICLKEGLSPQNQHRLSPVILRCGFRWPQNGLKLFTPGLWFHILFRQTDFQQKLTACESSLSRPAVPQSWRGSCCANWIRWSVYMYIVYYILYVRVWVNYNNSLTWNVGPFGDDFPYEPWFQWGRTVRSFYFTQKIYEWF